MNTSKDKRHNKDFTTQRRDNRKAKLASRRLDEKSQRSTKEKDYE